MHSYKLSPSYNQRPDKDTLCPTYKPTYKAKTYVLCRPYALSQQTVWE